MLTCLMLFSYAQTGISVTKVITEATEDSINAPRKKPILLQTLRGWVVDEITNTPLENSHVYLFLDSVRYFGAITNKEGYFEFTRTPVGRHILRISHIGYLSVALTAEVTSSRESFIQITLQEKISELDPIRITRDDIKYINDFNSLRSISITEQSLASPIVSGEVLIIEDLQRTAGTRFESSRQMPIFAGIQSVDDSRNDIVIRGNSPGSVLWRLEGINIPNPNHFAIPGTSGGPVTLINDRMLQGTTFYSGAFPAAYGNTTSGLFDLNFRAGNHQHYNHSFLLGVMGMEFSSEGPLSPKKNSSYLVTARYSSVSMFQKIGLDIGLNSYPYYGDLAFKLNFQGKKNSQWSVFGLGGISDIDILINQDTTNIYGERDRDQYFQSNTGITGVSFKKPVRQNGQLSATLAVSGQQTKAYHELVYSGDIRQDIINYFNSSPPVTWPGILYYNFRETRISGATSLVRKMKGVRGQITYGVLADLYLMNYYDRAVNIDISDSENYRKERVRWNAYDEALLLQPYVQWKRTWKNTDLILGGHGQYFSLSNSYAAEPRLAFRQRVKKNHLITAGLGMHSQIQAPYLYFYGPENDVEGNPIPVNQDMGFTRSIHSVLGYQYFMGPADRPVRLKVETYYQYLYQVPIEKDIASSFSLINTGATFTRIYPNALTNEGVGKNYGLEVSVDRSFEKDYLFMVNTSLFRSIYQGSDGIWRNTDFNGNYVVNALGAKEWHTKNQNTWAVSLRGTAAGGRRHGIVDLPASNARRETVFTEDAYNELQFAPYIRFDVRFMYKVNLRKASHQFAVDLFNIFDRQNVLRYSYRADFSQWDKGLVQQDSQLGFTPFIYYRIDF
jgi:hypothetical protein